MDTVLVVLEVLFFVLLAIDEVITTRREQQVWKEFCELSDQIAIEANQRTFLSRHLLEREITKTKEL